uniref:uncharacterized protein LOC122583637 n=1 Tax=Erigeron canadensis TaxID=72917 RepID=UPI001CB961E7|nr:uncharacterized protein LOC122583637 [Erigeron canadensis]
MEAAREEEEEEGDEPVERVPVFRRRVVLHRRRHETNERLMRFYFVDDPVYLPREFRRRYCMSKCLFLQIASDLEEGYTYFHQRYDCRGKLGFTPIQKCRAALRQLAYGSTVDSFDENFEMSARVLRESLAKFCKGVIDIYGPTFLRRPTSSDIQRLYDVYE